MPGSASLRRLNVRWREAHRRVRDQFLVHLGEHNNLVEYRQFSVVSQ